MRRLSLLWGSHTEEGRSGLTIKAIVMAAMEIADAEGLDALSMRRVAQRLDVGTMSLYTHIPGKTELLDLMLDTAYGEAYQRVEEPSEQPGDWRDAMRFVAQRNWSLFLAHPWMLQTYTERPAFGPHLSLKYEAELRPLDGLGLSDVEMDAALTIILTHVEGCARAMIVHQRTQADSGISDAEWWLTQEPILASVMSSMHLPVSGRVGTAAGQEHQAITNPEYMLKFGLDRILAGLTELIRANTSAD
ncbi:MAG: TetR/AcrR family transcriptional regulator C-terminal domain-containing protein [Anaerolineae bacterium]|nr:TetR/AcrR family transcriptional regulator C-terminal domain-containing protein [Anaerolineae bacterium]